MELWDLEFEWSNIHLATHTQFNYCHLGPPKE
jgi:hypothetical protein